MLLLNDVRKIQHLIAAVEMIKGKLKMWKITGKLTKMSEKYSQKIREKYSQ